MILKIQCGHAAVCYIQCLSLKSTGVVHISELVEEELVVCRKDVYCR